MNSHSRRQKAAILAQPSAEAALWPLGLKTFAVLTAIISILIILIGWTEYKSDYKSLTAEAKAHLNQQTQMVQYIFKTVTGDLSYLSEQVHLAQYLETGLDETLATLSEEYLVLSESRQIYDQIRYIDKSGLEIVRVDLKDGNSVLVAQEALQNKADRYYFIDSVYLPEDVVYVSPFDLNIENGAIEEPYKPMIRFALPVHDDEGRHHGIVVLNYLGSEMLRFLQAEDTDNELEVMLLNSDSYWLSAPDSDQAWRFMFPDREDIKFANSYPEAWAQMQTAVTGEFKNDQGYFAFTTIAPLSGNQISSIGDLAHKGIISAENYTWKLVVHISQASLTTRAYTSMRQLILPTIILLMLAAVGSFVFAQLYSRQQQANQMLKDREDLLGTIVDYAADWEFWYCTRMGLFRYVSPACKAVTGYLPDAFLEDQKLMLTIVHEDDRDKVAKHLAHFYAEDESGQLDFRILTQSGDVRWISQTYTAVYTPEGENLGLRGSNHDITRRKQIENDLMKAKVAAEAGTKVKSDFLATMSHEIRTPMNGVIGMTDLLLRTELTTEQHDYVETVRVSGESLLTIINDILDFSKIESGNMILEKAPFLLAEVIEPTLELLAIKANQKKLELVYEIEPSVPTAIIGDSIRLRQILINLLGNALKFTENGEVGLHVAKVPDTEDQLQFTVYDSGIGIPADKMGTLFRAFSQVDATTTRKYGGTGLGLAICKQLVSLMKGDIWVESEVGHGTQFTFTIQAPKASAVAQSSESKMNGVLNGHTVLIVDDHETNRRVLQSLPNSGAWCLRPFTAARRRSAC